MIMRSLDHFVCIWDIRCTVFGVYSRWLDFFLKRPFDFSPRVVFEVYFSWL